MFARPQLSTKPVSSWWESDDLVGKRSQRRAAEKSGYWHRWLLRLRRERPRRRAAEQRDELAAFHSITSSARASSVGGISRPNALAVLRLMTNSYLVGSMTGRSAGFAPLTIRATQLAACRYDSVALGP